MEYHGVNGYQDNGYGYKEQLPCQFMCFWVTHGVDVYESNGTAAGRHRTILFSRDFSKLRLKTEINPVL